MRQNSLTPLLLALLCLLLTSACGEKKHTNSSSDYSEVAAPYPAAMMEYISSLPQLIVHTEEQIPSKLHWQSGEGLAEIGDPAAKKGGELHFANVGPFPSHLRGFGGGGFEFFNFTLFDNIEIPLVQLHPLCPQQGIIAGLAEAWAVSEDGRSVTYRINPEARYSNGRPVRARDFLMGIYVRCSEAARDPFALQGISQQIESITLYSSDEKYLTVTLRRKQLLAPYRIAQLLHPAEPHFYAEYGADFIERYAQRMPPTTGAYTLKEEDMQRNRRITLSKVPQWWAAQLPHYRYRYNLDKLHIHFLQDEAQIWELFLRGELQFHQTRNIAAWQEKLQHQHVYEGRIEKRRFIANYPLPTYGIYLNCKTLPQLKLRQGLLHSMDMNPALDRLFRGEYERLSCFSEGYGELTPKAGEITPYSYQPSKARAAFAEAGYIKTGDDGILMKEDGTRLSLSICYVPSEKVTVLIRQLVQSAAQCGVELIGTPLTWQQCAEEVEEKRYQLAFWADVASTPLPELHRQFHSKHKEKKGYNLHSVEDKQLDEALEKMQQAGDMESMREATLAANRRIIELAIWLPGWKENRAYIASWRQLRFPEVKGMSPSTPAPYDVQEAHLFWMDAEGYPADGVYEEVDEQHQG